MAQTHSTEQDTAQDAIDAISESQARDEIVTVSVRIGSPQHHALCAELQARCDDSVDTTDRDGNEVGEYWGEDDDGEWRVHVHAVYPRED